MEDSQEKDYRHYSFLGNDTLPNLYDALVYERKFKSECLERQIYERFLKSEPSVVKLIIENKSDLSKLSCLIPVRLSPRPSRLIDFGDVSQTNGLE